jgi:hypothetical protein
MFIIIVILLWLVRDIHKDVVDADHTLSEVIIENAGMDTLLIKKTNEIDSLKNVIDWYKKREDDSNKNKKIFTKPKKSEKINTPVVNDSL